MDSAQLIGFLARFGYLGSGSGTALAPQPESLGGDALDVVDDHQAKVALMSLQSSVGLEPTGELDTATANLISAPRCALKDRSIAASAPKPWAHRDLLIFFGDLTGVNVDESDFKAAVLRACATWESAGVGIQFSETSDEPDAHISVACRPSEDEDYDMSGSVVAHADSPPGMSEIVDEPPLPLHFDREVDWDLAPASNQHDVETVALHELGHCLGLPHNTETVESVMFPWMFPGVTNRTLNDADLLFLRLLYPVPS